MKKRNSKFKFILINLAIAILIICGVATYVLYWLDDYTDHGSFTEVPVLEGYTFEEADEVASHLGLEVQIIDSLYDDDAKPGSIVEQYPSGGSHVKAGRIIRLTMNAQKPEMILVPDLRNSAYRQTIRSLHSKGFKIGKIEYVPSEFQNLVLNLKYKDQEIEPGTKLVKGETIDIVLGEGTENKTVTIPSIIGRTLNEAINLLRMSFLNIGEIIPDESITSAKEQKNALIYLHEPTIEMPVDRGTAINLYITLDKEKLVPADSLMITE